MLEYLVGSESPTTTSPIVIQAAFLAVIIGGIEQSQRV